MSSPTTKTLFGMAYDDIVIVMLTGMGQTLIDSGSFADDGQTPPVNFTATCNGGLQQMNAPMSLIMGVIGNVQGG